MQYLQAAKGSFSKEFVLKLQRDPFISFVLNIFYFLFICVFAWAHMHGGFWGVFPCGLLLLCFSCGVFSPGGLLLSIASCTVKLFIFIFLMNVAIQEKKGAYMHACICLKRKTISYVAHDRFRIIPFVQIFRTMGFWQSIIFIWL